MAKISIVQVGVMSVVRQQGLVSSFLNDPAVLEDNDAIS